MNIRIRNFILSKNHQQEEKTTKKKSRPLEALRTHEEGILIFKVLPYNLFTLSPVKIEPRMNIFIATKDS